MSLLRITLLMVAGATVQSMLPIWAFTGSLDWPVLTCLLMVVVLHSDRGGVIYASILAGLLYDSLSPAPLGISMPFFMMLGIGLHLLKTELFVDQPITYCVLGLLAVSLKTIWLFVVFSLGGLRPVQPGLLATRLIGGLLLGILTAPAVFLLVSMSLRIAKSKRRRL
jgi:rod shape-determining protein MreD